MNCEYERAKAGPHVSLCVFVCLCAFLVLVFNAYLFCVFVVRWDSPWGSSLVSSLVFYIAR